MITDSQALPATTASASKHNKRGKRESKSKKNNDRGKHSNSDRGRYKNRRNSKLRCWYCTHYRHKVEDFYIKKKADEARKKREEREDQSKANVAKALITHNPAIPWARVLIAA